MGDGYNTHSWFHSRLLSGMHGGARMFIAVVVPLDENVPRIFGDS